MPLANSTAAPEIRRKALFSAFLSGVRAVLITSGGKCVAQLAARRPNDLPTPVSSDLVAGVLLDQLDVVVSVADARAVAAAVRGSAQLAPCRWLSGGAA